ncbi:MAG: hypothetical protein HXY43_20555 [Fischerella sp.]|jgi:hypothetical protein|uniref:hypothetical protein n=1 Tax=Fischerella sp. TaxID=1191 RepID=UPI001824E301|nr:hypothetical protein [Fischerella sp.]NWF61573.1 hypothetical protein [Fischerella sp.]
MQNSQPTSNQPINALTVTELEALIVKIVQKVLKQETEKLETVQPNNPPQAFLETFGTWEDTRTTEEIIDDIYSNRTIATEEYS